MEENSTANSWVSWVRMFDIPETSKHKDGFTIYKVVSFLYPESCPDAVTRVIVWKRFNDFKKLHQEIKKLHKKLHLKDTIPILPKSVLFKRFDEETINQRKRGILNLLEYTAAHASLFTSSVFVKFFESSHAPADSISGNITAIRANLNLPEDIEYGHSDEDKTTSDTDSFTSSNLGSTAQAIDLMSDSLTRAPPTNLKKLNSMTSIDSQLSETGNSLQLFDGQYLTETTSQYLTNASIHVNMAIELENDKQYEEAFAAYKTAVDILISGGKEDPDFDRRQMVRYKTEKYLIRAERIYNMYLAPEVKDLQLLKEGLEKQDARKGPLYDLYKYKVIKIIPCGMLVMHSEEQQLYYVKAVHKTVQFPNNQLILPRNVPYMVKLINHYSTDSALFLILEYSSGTKLRDVLQNKTSNPTDDRHSLLRKIQELSDNESELSFSDLLSEYASNKHQRSSKEVEKDDEDEGDDSDGSFEKIDLLQETSQSSSSPLSVEAIRAAAPAVATAPFCPYQASVTQQQVVKWAAQLLVALEKLHSLGVVCGDLTIDDLSIDERDDLILDYVCNVKDTCELHCRDVNFNLAPEVYSFEDVTEAVDWWSFGAVLYELLVGVPLSQLHINGVTSYTHLVVPKYVSIEGRSLLKQLLIWDPRERLGSKSKGVQHLKSHPFFRSVTWSDVESKSAV